MTTIWQDLRYAARVLRQSPGFTATSVTVLAIGIGANSAIFSPLDAVLLRPLPYQQPAQLAMLYEHPPGNAPNRVSPLNYLDWSEQNQVFSSMAAVSGGSRTLSSASGPAEKIPGQPVTVSLFDVLGVKALVGRTFMADDARIGNSVVVLSERLWRDRFGADPHLVGRSILLDGQPFSVRGVVPASFQIFYESKLWTNFVPKRSPEQRRMHYLQVIGRLKPGVDLNRARAGMAVVADGIARASPETNRNWTVTIEPLREAIVGADMRLTSLALAGVAGFVLLMVCANIANLLLARGTGRTREIAVRASLGGSRARIVAQLLTESSLLAVLGGIAGIALAWVIVRASPSFLPSGTLPAALTLSVDARFLAFAAAVTLATGVLFGLAPELQSARIPLAEALRAGGRAATGAAAAFRALLAVGKIAIAVMLVAGAGLLPEQALTFYQAAEREIASLPGVRSTALGGNLPLDGWDIGMGFKSSDLGSSTQPSAHYQMISTKYFETLGIPFMMGRAFSPHETAGRNNRSLSSTKSLCTGT